MTPLRMRGVVKRLRKIEEKRPPVLNFDTIRPEVRRLVERLALSHSDRDISTAVNAHLTGRIQEFWAEAQRTHNITTAELSELATKVRAYVQEIERLDADVQNRYIDINAAVIHALDRISDPDTPLFDPLPPHIMEDRR